jgi:hypothetical protein
MDRDRRTRTGARAPGAESNPHSKAAHRGVVGPSQNGTTESDYEVREGQKQTRRTSSNAGSQLKRWMFLGRRCLKCQPSSRTGENPPYGMIGGTVETSASFEARSAPLSYPTAGGDQRWSSLPRQLSCFRAGISPVKSASSQEINY